MNPSIGYKRYARNRDPVPEGVPKEWWNEKFPSDLTKSQTSEGGLQPRLLSTRMRGAKRLSGDIFACNLVRFHALAII